MVSIVTFGTASVNTVWWNGSNQTQINLTNVHDIHQYKHLHPPQYVRLNVEALQLLVMSCKTSFISSKAKFKCFLQISTLFQEPVLLKSHIQKTDGDGYLEFG